MYNVLYEEVGRDGGRERYGFFLHVLNEEKLLTFLPYKK